MNSLKSGISRSGPILVLAMLCAGPAGRYSNGGLAMDLTLKSPAFVHEGFIPKKHTCDGADVSPALQWSGPPAGTVSLSHTMDDPDAPGRTWVHWVLYRIPAQARELPEGLLGELALKDGSRQGRNDFSRPGYGGPCPPKGAPHRYFFKLYALDSAPDLPPGARKADLEKAMEGHILAQTQLMGRYQR